MTAIVEPIAAIFDPRLAALVGFHCAARPRSRYSSNSAIQQLKQFKQLKQHRIYIRYLQYRAFWYRYATPSCFEGGV